MSDDVNLPVPLTHFAGGANLTEGSGSLAELLNNFDGRLGSFHVPIASVSQADGPAGTVPDVQADGALSYLLFDGLVGVQKVYRVFKIPPYFVGEPTIHIHWTKSDDIDRSGEVARWVVSYHAFNGRDDEAGLAPTVFNLDDAYESNDTTPGGRIVYRTPNSPDLVGLQRNYYLAVAIEKGTPGAGTPMDSPGLVSCDLTFTGYVNRTSAPVT